MKPIVIIPVVAALAIGSFLIASSFTHNNPVKENPPLVMINPNYVLSISNGTITIPSRSYTFYHFSAPNDSSTARIKGDYSMNGNGSNLKIYVLDGDNFINWKNGHQFNTYYDSGNNTSGTIDVVVPPGKILYLVYANTISSIQSKPIHSEINLIYS